MRQFTSKQDFCDWLNQFEHPSLAPGWASTANVVSVEANRFTIEIPFAANTLTQDLSDWMRAAQDKREVGSFSYNIVVAPKSLETHVPASVKGVKNVIAVTSAKGGVGKSTTSVNLALALAKSGAKVGLLDADIYGPSVPLMLGKTNAQPEVRDNKWMQPIAAHGIFTHSIGYLVSKDEAAIWRGPMASRALNQVVNETNWPELDVLLVDMPPGTGDIQLTMSENIKCDGALIVTTPQNVALADAEKGINMFNKVNTPVLGVVENMSQFTCPNCHAVHHLFGTDGGERIAKQHDVPCLAHLPLVAEVRQAGDNGKPYVLNEISDTSYRQLAFSLMMQLSKNTQHVIALT